MRVAAHCIAALAIASPSAALVSGCKKESKADTDASIAKRAAFRDEMCACRDTPCADKVHAVFEAWSAERAKARKTRSTQEQRTQVTEISQAYGRCMVAAKTPAPVAPIDAAVDAAPPDVPPPPTNARDATGALRAANIWARETYRSAVGHIEVKYVDKDGLLDPDDGELKITFGFDRSDDPKRRTGAPTKEPTFANQCFALTLFKGEWARRNDVSCGKTMRAPTCALSEIWRRAIEAKAPPDAVAVLTLDLARGQPIWLFRVADPARGVDFMHLVVDDCPIEVEK